MALCLTGSNVFVFGKASNKWIRQVKNPTFFYSINLIKIGSAPVVVTASGFFLNKFNRAKTAFFLKIGGTFSGSFYIN